MKISFEKGIGEKVTIALSRFVIEAEPGKEIKILNYGYISTPDARELIKAIQQAIDIANGEIQYEHFYRKAGNHYLVSGMPDNSYGYVSKGALYVDSGDNNRIYVEYNWIPTDIYFSEGFMLFKHKNEEYFANLAEIDYSKLRKKKYNNFDFAVKQHEMK